MDLKIDIYVQLNEACNGNYIFLCVSLRLLSCEISSFHLVMFAKSHFQCIKWFQCHEQLYFSLALEGHRCFYDGRCSFFNKDVFCEGSISFFLGFKEVEEDELIRLRNEVKTLSFYNKEKSQSG